MRATVSGDDVPALENGVVVHRDTRGPVQHLQEGTIPTPCVRDVIHQVVLDLNMIHLLARKVVVIPEDVEPCATMSQDVVHEEKMVYLGQRGRPDLVTQRYQDGE